MQQTHSVLWNGNRAGTLQLTREGLYYRVDCSCNTIDKQIYRLLGRWGDTQLRLGVLIPEGNEMRLRTKIPAKKLAGKQTEFWLERVCTAKQEPVNLQRDGRYIPIYPDEPYAYLSKLKDSYLEIRNGQPGLMITG